MRSILDVSVCGFVRKISFTFSYIRFFIRLDPLMQANQTDYFVIANSIFIQFILCGTYNIFLFNIKIVLKCKFRPRNINSQEKYSAFIKSEVSFPFEQFVISSLGTTPCIKVSGYYESAAILPRHCCRACYKTDTKSRPY